MNSEQLAAARAYHELGLTVLPFVVGQDGKKHPSIDSWAQWESRPQTESEFEALHLEKYTMFGLVCGTPIQLGNETVYFTVIDRDVKDPQVTNEVKQKTLEAINQMRVTQRETTRSGGNHLNYYSRTTGRNSRWIGG